MPKNPLRASLAQNKLTIGSFQAMIDPASSDILLGSGLDWVLVDTEHRPMGPETVERMVRAAHGVGPNKSVMVRVPSVQRGPIQHAREAGADALLVPLVNSKEEAEEVAALSHYPPKGTRGLNYATVASGWGVPDPKAYLDEVNREVVVGVQIETKEGLDNVEAIASVEGVDLLYVGPTDLSNALGLVGQLNHPDLRAAIERIFKVGLEHGKWLGVLAVDPEFAKWCVDRGVRLLTYTSDARFMKGAVQASLKQLEGLAD